MTPSIFAASSGETADAVQLRLEALALVCLAVALAVLVPPVLAKARWPSRNPRAALVVWQAVGLGGGLAILGAGLTLAVADLGSHWLTGLAALPTGWSRLRPLGWLGIVVFVVAGGWLSVVLFTSTRRVVRVRKDHRQRLDLLTDDLIVREHTGAEVALVRLLDHSMTAAYCLPGLRPQIVLSSGTVATLSTAELAAVVVHERAHARGRHDLVIHPFRAWRETFPFLPTAQTALTSVELLVEMLADDAARARCGAPALTGALDRLADREFGVRIARLRTPQRSLGALASATAYVVAVALVLAPPLLLAFT